MINTTVYFFNTIVGVFTGNRSVALSCKVAMAQGKKKKRDPVLAEFAASVRKRRYALSLTQEELAERAGFHVNYIGGIERAERNPSLTSLATLAKGLQCSVKDLLPRNL